MRGKVRRKYDKELKTMVVNLCLSGRKFTEVALEMDLDRSMVQCWVREYNTYKDNSFKGNGNPVMTVEQDILYYPRLIGPENLILNLKQKYRVFAIFTT